jgi:hypothetical protein
MHCLSYGSRSCLPTGRAPAPDPASLLGGLRRYHTSYGSLWAVGLKYKKSLACLPMQLGSHVPNARTHVSKAHDIRAIMTQQDVRACCAINACKTYE